MNNVYKDWQNDSRNYKLGIFYFNPKDDRLFVPKRIGIGWTLNFANKYAFLTIFGFIAAGLISTIASKLLK